MKVKYYLLSALLTGGLLSSCSDNDGAENRSVDETGEPASISVQLVGSKSGTRATQAGTNEENYIKNFGVYVFNSSDVLENYAVVTDAGTDGLTKKIEDLTTGTKKIVVFANLASYPGVTNSVTTYAGLTSAIHLDDQNNVTGSIIGIDKGLAMSETQTETLAKGDNPVNMYIRRAVAKIVIGTVKINQDLAAYPHEFKLTDVHIMKAMPYADVKSDTVISKIGTASGFYGGLIDDDNYATKVNKDYLTKTFTTPIENTATNSEGFTVYLLPNEEEDDATLLTFQGTYNGADVYYPFRINEVIQTAGDGTGEYIKRNTVHTINVEFKNPGTGRNNPEEPLDPADLTITVIAADWTVVPTHNLEW